MEKLKLNYQTSREESENLLLCLHGNSADSNYFLSLLDGIDGWKVVAPDIVGHGKSPRLKPEEYTVSSFVQPIVDVLLKFSYKKLVIVGHSLGGNLAAELTKHLKVDGIILMASMPLSYTKNKPPYAQIPELILNDEDVEKNMLVEEYLKNFGVTSKNLDAVKKAFLNTDANFRVRLVEEFMAGKFSDHLQLLNDSNLKIAGIFDPSDHVVNQELLKELNDDGLFDELYFIQKTGHYPLLEDPKNCCRRIGGFLNFFN